jgi:chromosome segregation ATPase
MMRLGRVCLVSLFLLATISGCVAKSDFEKVQSDLVASQSQYQTAQSDLSKLKTEHDSLTGDFETLTAQAEKLASDLEALTKEKETLQREKQALEDQLKAAKAKQSTAELGKNSAEVSLKVLQGKVEKASIKAEILDLIFSQVSNLLFPGTTVRSRSETVEMGLKLQKLIVEADDPALDEKFTALVNDPNDKKASLEFFVYLVSDLAKQLR